MNTLHQEEQGGEVDRALEELRGRLAGSVVEPQDPVYDEARAVWNGMIDVRPRAVIRAGAVEDIDPVLHTARRTGLPLAVRGGGHNIAGHGTVDGGLVLDLGQLRGVEVESFNATGASFTGVTVMLTVATAEVSEPSFTLKANESGPW